MSSTAKQPSKTSSTSFPALQGDHWIEPLRDGTRVLVRPLQGKDRPLEEEFIQKLSPEARRYRFLCDFKEPSTQLIDQLMHVDYEHDMAFVALAHDDGHLREVGVSRATRAARGTIRAARASVLSDQRCRYVLRSPLKTVFFANRKTPDATRGRVAWPGMSRQTFTLMSTCEPSRLMMDTSLSTVNRLRLALRIREKSAAAMPVRMCAARTVSCSLSNTLMISAARMALN